MYLPVASPLDRVILNNSSSVQNSCWHVPMKTDTAPVLEHLPAEVGLGVGYQRGQGGARVFANE